MKTPLLVNRNQYCFVVESVKVGDNRALEVKVEGRMDSGNTIIGLTNNMYADIVT